MLIEPSASKRLRATVGARFARRAQRKLLRQQLVEHQAAPRRIGALLKCQRIGVGRRPMQALDRILQTRSNR